MAAIVGAAGLPATLAAARAGKQVLLANKEALVMSGALFMRAIEEGGATILPIDSEHSAIFQSLPRGFACGRAGEFERAGVRRVLLTASGGPFRTTPIERLAQVTREQACAHPNWVMGPKISVDSATMMNKGLEVIEAHLALRRAPGGDPGRGPPQSVIHSMVEYHDGSVIAQLGAPDMRTPIACALAWPERIDSGVAPLDFTTLGRLDFERVDRCVFPACASPWKRSARAARPRGAQCCQRNRRRSVSRGRLGFTEIARVIEKVLDEVNAEPLVSLEQAYAADVEARALRAASSSRRAPPITARPPRFQDPR
jgi:1-deoxy-D-xylulose-5-phosphate reductoisomerase